jgi:hypothetical protein
MTTPNLETYHALIREMDERLMTASHSSCCAIEAIKHGERNQAIGALLPTQNDIAEAAAILQTLLTLHRGRRVGQGGAR